MTLGTYGLMVAIALICAFFILRADFARRGISADAEAIIGITGLAGLAGSRLYHLLESPAEFFADPWPQLFSTMGFAFVGAVIGGFIALVLLAWRFRIKPLLMLDVAAPAAALGYGIGRLGCLISGDGDYGKPTTLPWGMAFPNGLVPTAGPDGTCVQWGAPPDCRVHPTPIYEFIVGVLIFYYLWRLGARLLKRYGEPAHGTALTSLVAVTAAKPGYIVAQFFILSGLARFLVEFIRIKPRSILGMSNAQAASLASIVLGIVLLIAVNRRSPQGV